MTKKKIILLGQIHREVQYVFPTFIGSFTKALYLKDHVENVNETKSLCEF